MGVLCDFPLHNIKNSLNIYSIKVRIMTMIVTFSFLATLCY